MKFNQKRVKRGLAAITAAAAAFFGLSSSVFACTTFIVGKNASADGSAYFGRTDDSHGTIGINIVTTPAQTGEGTWIYEDTATGLQAELPVEGCQYYMTSAFPSANKGIKGEAGGNEYGVYISATETLRANEEALAADPYIEAGVAESNIPTLVLPYIKSAKEGVQMLAEMVEKYGSAESNGVIFGDSEEIWYMEIYTGHQWAAVRCPDDCYAVIGNDAMIGYIDLEDTDNYLACDDIISLPEDNGFLQEIDGQFNLALTYNQELRDYSQIRVWAGRKWFSSSTAGDYDVNYRYDIFEVPDEKIELGDLMDFTRYRYEDTEYSCDIEGNNYRPIGIERTATTHIFQLREEKPSVSWISLANPEFSVFMPLYENLSSVPECFLTDTNDEYSDDSAYWQFRSVSALATLNRTDYGTLVRDAYKDLETKWIDELDEMDEEYIASGESPEKAAELFAAVSSEALSTASSLQGQLLTLISKDISKQSDAYGMDIEPATTTTTAAN